MFNLEYDPNKRTRREEEQAQAAQDLPRIWSNLEAVNIENIICQTTRNSALNFLTQRLYHILLRVWYECNLNFFFFWNTVFECLVPTRRLRAIENKFAVDIFNFEKRIAEIKYLEDLVKVNNKIKVRGILSLTQLLPFNQILF